MIPTCWRGCRLLQCHQPWNGAQGVSGAIRGCSVPALLGCLDWATLAPCLGYSMWVQC